MGEERATFKDAKGETWAFVFGYDTFRRVREDVGIDLLKPMPRSKDKDSDGEEEPVIMQLDRDVVLLIDVMFATLKPRLEEKEISPTDFGESHVPPEKLVEATRAFWEGYQDFFQKIGWVDAVEAIQRQTKVTNEIRKRSVAKIARVAELTLNGFDAKADKVIDDIEEEMMNP